MAGTGPVPALGEATWTEVSGSAASTVLAVPVGATEQHGPHLPLATDTDLAVHLAARLALGRPAVLAAPPVSFGASGEHAGFPGTLSIGTEVLEQVLVELARSADAWAGVVFVSAHGGNAGPLRRAVELLEREGRAVLAWSPSTSVVEPLLGGRPADAHAGLVETSLVMALDGGAVRADRVAPGELRPLAAILPELRRTGVAPVSPGGVLGDPTGATAALGARLADALTADLLAAFDRWAVTLAGRVTAGRETAGRETAGREAAEREPAAPGAAGGHR